MATRTTDNKEDNGQQQVWQTAVRTMDNNEDNKQGRKLVEDKEKVGHYKKA